MTRLNLLTFFCFSDCVNCQTKHFTELNTSSHVLQLKSNPTTSNTIIALSNYHRLLQLCLVCAFLLKKSASSFFYKINPLLRAKSLLQTTTCLVNILEKYIVSSYENEQFLGFFFTLPIQIIEISTKFFFKDSLTF